MGTDATLDPPDAPTALTAGELDAWRGMLAVHARVTRLLDAELAERHALSLRDYEVLMLLGEAGRGGVRISVLSERALLSVSGVSRLVDRLVARGLVLKEPCADDGRGAQARLTDDGRAALRVARATHLAGIREHFLSAVDPADLEVLAGTWRAVLGRDPAA